MKKYLRGKGSRNTFSPLDSTFRSQLNMNPKVVVGLKSTSTGKSEFAFVLKGLQNYLDFCSPCRCSQFAHYCCSNITHFLSSVEEQHETMQFSSSWIMYKYWMKNIPIPYLPKKMWSWLANNLLRVPDNLEIRHISKLQKKHLKIFFGGGTHHCKNGFRNMQIFYVICSSWKIFYAA